MLLQSSEILETKLCTLNNCTLSVHKKVDLIIISRESILWKLYKTNARTVEDETYTLSIVKQNAMLEAHLNEA